MINRIDRVVVVVVWFFFCRPLFHPSLYNDNIIINSHPAIQIAQKARHLNVAFGIFLRKFYVMKDVKSPT